ncbi:winged helix domain-containing protein [Staphylococcus aureus]
MFLLRHEHGIDIETVVEPHGGPFAGRHGRYVLREPLRVIEREAA